MSTRIPSELLQVLLTAAEAGDIAAVRELLPKHPQAPSYAFVQAVHRQQFELLEFLTTEWRTHIENLCYTTELLSSLLQFDQRMASFLLNHGADINAPITLVQDTPLMMAAACGMPEIVADLVKRGADLEKRGRSLVCKISGSDEGDTALIRAIRWNQKTDERGRVESIKLLIEAGANVNALGEGGKTALDRVGTAAKFSEIRKLLLAAGAKSGKELRPAKVALATPKPKSPKPVEGINNFSQASALLASLCGSQPQAHPQLPWAQFFQFRPATAERAPIGKALLKRLEKIRHEAAPQVREAGCFVLRSHVPGTAFGLCLLRAKDKFDVVKKFNFGSGNYGVPTAKAITFLHALDRTVPFTLLACDKSALTGRFQARPKRGMPLAGALRKLGVIVSCDLAYDYDDRDNDVEFLARHLEKGGDFTLWWD